ncbi:MAG: hypothetical protein DMG57_06515 [Acidobacteria bacterium]|nr:MAG: hypothetical protein DMG57_06515 [Acidobacteriota bacterium]
MLFREKRRECGDAQCHHGLMRIDVYASTVPALHPLDALVGQIEHSTLVHEVEDLGIGRVDRALGTLGERH